MSWDAITDLLLRRRAERVQRVPFVDDDDGFWVDFAYVLFGAVVLIAVAVVLAVTS